jgi:hypothetical protein
MMSSLRHAVGRLVSIAAFAFSVLAATWSSDSTSAIYEYQLTATWQFTAGSALPASGGGVGTIGFNDLTGLGAADPDFTLFSFTVTDINGSTLGLPFTFDKTTVTDVGWIIDPSDFSLDLLFLDTSPQQTSQAYFDLAFGSPGGLTIVDCAGDGSAFFGVSAAVCRRPIVGGVAVFAESVGGTLTATFAPTATVAEPDTLALLICALLMISCVLRRRLIWARFGGRHCCVIARRLRLAPAINLQP